MFLLLLFPASPALAVSYSDGTYRYSIDLPEGSDTYYYTQESSNMPEDLLTVAQSKNPPVRFLSASYENGLTLSYSLDMTAVSLETVLPELSGKNITDLSELSDGQIDLLSQSKKAEYGSLYAFGADDIASLAGKTALVLTGRLTDDVLGGQTEDPYTTVLYLAADNNCLFSITLRYKNDDTGIALEQAENVLATLHFDSTPVVSPAASPSSLKSDTLSVSPLPVSSDEAGPKVTVSTVSGGASQFFRNLSERLSYAYYNDPYFPIYVAGACIVAALVIIIIILIAARRRRDKMDGYEENRENATTEELADEGGTADLSDDMPASAITRPTIAEEALSRRTPQTEAQIEEAPAANPVPTEPEEQDAVLSEHDSIASPSRDFSRPKVGSRVERYGRKKK